MDDTMTLVGKSRLLCALFIVVSALSLFAETGTLTVVTSPAGAEVWLNNQFIGNAPIMEKIVASGRYTLKLVDPIQRTTLSEQVLITAAQAVVIEKTIKPKFGSLSITTEPVPAEVFITMPLGRTPISSNFLNPGKYQLEIRPLQKFFKPSISTIVIGEGSESVLVDTLKHIDVLTPKALLRLGLGAGALGGLVWAATANGRYHKLVEQNNPGADAVRGWAITGAALGALCVLSFEIVAFF
jgi:hypothetical protein